ncbi:hypothetical protein RRF57_012397 [Xylaria bambusicola]|uniref:Uncharacterized protein n=1 Tax=Xylaria bambusicola TaxID=326684 RepID=A0AAN7UPN0_9PEZI
MDPDDISSKDPETQLVLKCRKKPEVGDEPIQVLRERGWSRFGDTTASAIFMPGRMIFEGGLHATHKLCVCGKIAVVGKVECEGTLMLHKGSIQCRYVYLVAAALLYLWPNLLLH